MEQPLPAETACCTNTPADAPVVIVHRRSTEEEPGASRPAEARKDEGNHFVPRERNRHPERNLEASGVVQDIGLER